MMLHGAGADIHVADNEGNTPLHVAAQYIGNYMPIYYLCHNGANVHARNAEGQTPLAIARKGCHESNIRALEMCGAKE